jgi:hypothetical protein
VRTVVNEQQGREAVLAWQRTVDAAYQQQQEALGANPPPPPADDGPTLSGIAHGVLDVAGLVPGFGEIADGVNALWYLAEGDRVSAGLSAAGAIPILGWGATAAKAGLRAADEVADAGAAARRNLAEPHPALTTSQRDELAQRRDQLQRDNEEQFQATRGDPDQSGRVTRNSQEEARTFLDLQQRGDPRIATYQRPAEPAQGDVIDANGAHWDVKSVHSDWPPEVPDHVRNSGPFPNRYDDTDFTRTVEEQFAQNRNVIVDTRNADTDAIDRMNEIVRNRGWSGRVIWYP